MLANRASTWATCLISANEENKYTVIPSALRFPKLQAGNARAASKAFAKLQIQWPSPGPGLVA